MSASLDGCVPRAHGGGGVRVAHAGVTLHVEPGRAESARTAETDAENAELRNDVVGVGALRSVAHGEARDVDGGDVDHTRADDAVPGDVGVLREVVVKGAKAGKIDGHETAF